MKFTIKSTSEEGIYYLVNHWNKHCQIWISEAEVQKKPEESKAKFFDSPSRAKASLTKLLKVMPEYATDEFELITIE